MIFELRQNAIQVAILPHGGNMIITLKDYEVRACHGVNAEEKVSPQRFLFTVEMTADVNRAAYSDDVNDTVSYSQVKKFVQAFATSTSFDLIETLADRTARKLLDSFDKLKSVAVTVKKPDAPMSGVFDYVSVRAERQWTRAYLSLGSSIGDKNSYLDLAISMLNGAGGVRNVIESSRITTAPYGGQAENEFLNSAVELYTYLEPEELLSLVERIERAGDRERIKRWGDRTLDVDILLYGDRVIDTKRLSLPHYDMINRTFVLKPLAELNPRLVHPLLKKTVVQLLEELN